jgi:membrane protein
MVGAPGIVARSIRDYFKDGGIMLSAALSFFAVTAFVPLCLFMVTIFGSVLGENREFFDFFTDKLFGLFPAITGGITAELKKLITYKGIGKTSLLLYGFLSLHLYIAMHKTMEAIFKVREERSFLGFIFLSFVVVTVLVSLVFVSFALTSAVPLIKALHDYMPWLRIGFITAIIVQYVMPLMIVQFAAVFIYMIIPKRKLRFSHAFWGGLFTALMLEAAKHVFTWYVGSVISLGTIYGSLSAFVMFLLWVFYSSAIFLIGGEIVYNLDEASRPRW